MGTFRGSASAALTPFSAVFKESEIKGLDSPSFTCGEDMHLLSRKLKEQNSNTTAR
jgi:hypothetical protein